jgi:cytochrome oxidase assembly protein ShyY1
VFTAIRVLGLNVKFISFLLKVSSVIHKNYELISTRRILRRKHCTIKNNEKVSKNENGKRRNKSKGGHSLLRPHLNVQEVKNDMLDYMRLVWIGLGGLSLAFAFVHYVYSYRKRMKI